MKQAKIQRNRQKPGKKKHQTTFAYILFNKPYGVLCQFTDPSGRATLSDFGPFPSDVYPTGRLDFDSEGLLLLTNDGTIQHMLLEPKFHHLRTYLVQVERIPDEASLEQLRSGVMIEGEKTLPSTVHLLTKEPEVPERSMPIRFRKNIPTCWLTITLSEGRNRQVRKMTAVIGHPTLRLIRIGIANLTIEGIQPGQHRMVTDTELTELKKILRQGNTNQKNSSPRRV